MVLLIFAEIAAEYPTVLVHLGWCITIIFIDEGIVKRNLREAQLEVVVSVVETIAIGQRQLAERFDVCLNLTLHLLGIVMVVVVLNSPVGVGDTVRCVPCLWCVEG